MTTGFLLQIRCRDQHVPQRALLQACQLRSGCDEVVVTGGGVALCTSNASILKEQDSAGAARKQRQRIWSNTEIARVQEQGTCGRQDLTLPNLAVLCHRVQLLQPAPNRIRIFNLILELCAAQHCFQPAAP